MREIVSLHVGQCGNQVGSAFWNLLLLEHQNTPDNDPALSSFFHFEESKSSRQARTMKARALLVDMECGPLQETMRSTLGGLFNETQYIMDVSGAGNNFAQGYYFYGPQYHDRFINGLQSNLEKCESLQGFFLTHSLGGGTGSGVGSYILHMLADEYPKVTRFSTCVYPSDEGDVITAPYNTMLATRELIRSADCVFPLNNSSLFSFYQLENPPKADDAASAPVQPSMNRKGRSKGFEGINNVAARMMCNLTAPSRFHGDMNVDINEIYTNLVPFTKMHFLMTALNVRYPMPQKLRNDHSRAALQRVFADIQGARGQLSGSIPAFVSEQLQLQQQPTTMLASAFFARGKVLLSDFLHCVQGAQKSMRFPEWNQDACKIGMCKTASPGEEMSVLGIYNSSNFAHVLGRDVSSFQRLFRKKAMLHHYTEYVEEAVVREAEQEVVELVEDYRSIDSGRFPQQADALPADFPLFPAF